VTWLLLLSALAYLGLLFGIAYYGDKRADAGTSLIANPYIYTLSIAVYCTAWTFYGSVGRATVAGFEFIAVYLGPSLAAVLWWLVLRKIVRISKVQRITSIPDFIASRYGKSGYLAGLVTVIAVVGIMPYIALQLKAVSLSFEVMSHAPELVMPGELPNRFGVDTALLVAVFLAVFAILFGTRHIDATERHEGMVLAVAFESLTKLVAFIAVGVAITYGVYDGFGDLFQRAAAIEVDRVLLFDTSPVGYASWLTITFLSMMAVIFLPRQFQILVVENVNEDHIRTASWLFPLYLLAINIFVVPLALAGLLEFADGSVERDALVLALPIVHDFGWVAQLVFLGGLSAATSMVIVASIALATMICNDLVMPVLLRIHALRLNQRTDLSGLLILIRRLGIVLVVSLGYIYYQVIGESYALVTIGLVSFAAAAQFAPAILFGIYWKGAKRLGAQAGLVGGFLVWFYTLMLPAFARSGWINDSVLEFGPFGLAWLKPYALFGLANLDPLTHGTLWSMLANIGGIVLVSLFTRHTAVERVQAELFVDVFRREDGSRSMLWRGTASVDELRALMRRFIGRREATQFFQRHPELAEAGQPTVRADAALVHDAERVLAGAIGAASARVMVSSVVKGETLSIEEVMTILDETSQILDYSHRLEEKSRQLERTSAMLRGANDRLRELDRLKDDFVTTVTHELRTPLTSIRAFSEILLSNQDIEVTQREEFLSIIVKESERLTRLINQVLDFAKLESGRTDWNMEQLDPRKVVEDAIAATSQLFKDRQVRLERLLPDHLPPVSGDYDRLMQVVINLLSNAVKFCAEKEGVVRVAIESDPDRVRLSVTDNGPGIPAAEHERIFEQFHQVSGKQSGKPTGTGLGLAISRRIVEFHEGRIWVDSEPGRGATFCIELPSVSSEALPTGETSQGSPA
jgi:Na+/proline symporter/nitrogen-specific signal transduction histidine kinase